MQRANSWVLRKLKTTLPDFPRKLIIWWYIRPDTAPHLLAILERIKSHRNAEATAGRPIWPASDIMTDAKAKDSVAESCKYKS